ncbi:radical SAM peptide maturase [Parabacteroides chinchillae]|uniref:Radical SAM core domain-containing protein n=1 Tax=Parabacteroides chinchillae TaxID=871327 RepID=A0A8G2F5E1_9BACT|nr:radical SAM peptide maturase [Parabacteroides chinchillae]SEG22841.1 uncharacterized protein SAMN05444001_1225 [Parabacteroides chinchillae]
MDNKYLTADDVKFQLANLRQLTFEVTDACNLCCKYCNYGELYNDYDKRKNLKISLPASLKLIDYLTSYWNSDYNVSAKRYTYISFYGGEPLLNMTFVKSIVDYIEKLPCSNRSFVFSMTSNALLLNQYMDYLVDHGFNLLISLDGDEHATSYRVNKTGKVVYSDIIRNIEILRKKYPEYFEHKVNFNAVLHNRNSVSSIYEFFKTHYNKTPSIGELNNMGVSPDKIKLFQDTYRNSEESLHQAENYEEIEQEMFLKSATYQTVTHFIHQYSGYVFRNYSDLLYGRTNKKIPTGTCLPFSKRMFVTVNGKILPCERIGQHFALGKVSDDSGVELDFEMIADRYNAYYAKLAPLCKKCHKAASCIQCLFNLKGLEDSPVCYGYMDKHSFEMYKSNQIAFLRKHPTDYYRIMEEVITE